MSKETKKELGFQVKDVELVNLHLGAPMKPMADDIDFKFDINLEHKWNADNNQILVACTITTRVNKAGEVVGRIEVACVYFFSDLNSFVDKKSGELKLPNEVVVTLNSVTVSTARGIMYTCFKGTFLHNALLPLIDINKLTNENAKY